MRSKKESKADGEDREGHRELALVAGAAGLRQGVFERCDAKAIGRAIREEIGEEAFAVRGILHGGDH